MNEEINKYVYDYELLLQTAEQIKKDLGLDEMPVTSSGNPQLVFNELKAHLIPVIRQALKSNHLQNILYRVDVNEREYREAVNDPDKDQTEAIAELIIRREFKKVVIRTYFREKNK